MATLYSRSGAARTILFLGVLFCLAGARARPGEVPPGQETEPSRSARGASENRDGRGNSPEAQVRFGRMLRDQTATDEAWRAASRGWMRMEKIVFKSAADGLDIPAFVFEPLDPASGARRPALVWVHENIRGHVYELGNRCGSRMVSSRRFHLPSSLALPGFGHLCPTTLTAQGTLTTSCPSERRRRLENLSAFSLARCFRWS